MFSSFCFSCLLVVLFFVLPMASLFHASCLMQVLFLDMLSQKISSITSSFPLKFLFFLSPFLHLPSSQTPKADTLTGKTLAEAGFLVELKDLV
ncbi:hypothetical protein QBC38DRAFT_492493 [Podospora fimiseda]|uniref:Uncharacterized protein n=1 Tax=Podospora fimiseda TaxID=252190 RepID=A0AAN7BEV1_9PEZI|nr:hypothetical protein QBC38DRAFT_492493 [Podospora fimiseda]